MDFSETFNKLSERVPKPIQATYIGDDGLLKCSKCHGKRETMVKLELKDRPVEYRKAPCICKCQQEALRAEEEAIKQRDKMRRVKELRSTGFQDKQLLDWTFENDDNSHPEVTKVAKRYVEKFDELKKDGKGLLFYGGVGTGKTYIAACIANALINRGIPVMVTNFARIANKLQESFDKRQAYLDSLNLFDLLVIDDLAAERKTEYMQEIVFNVIDARYRSGLPMIITTNLSIETLKKSTDASDVRIFDRILEQCYPIEVKGVSHRRKNIVKDNEHMKGMLGLN